MLNPHPMPYSTLPSSSTDKPALTSQLLLAAEASIKDATK